MMLDLRQRIHALANLGDRLRLFVQDPGTFPDFDQKVNLAFHKNGWFTREMVMHSIRTWADQLTLPELRTWTEKYSIPEVQEKPKKIAIIMAGNVPLVGFHDLLSVFLSGHIAVTKLSVQDDLLMGHIIDMLLEADRGLKEHILPAPPRLKEFDAVIATGSNNTQRYFDYYFGKAPHIFRKNRTSIAILDGNETESELEALMDDVFLYFGLGCRNVSLLYLPRNFNLDRLFSASLKYRHLADHKKYMNNFTYHKSIFMMEKVPVMENGLFMLREENSLTSPVSVLNYSRYNNKEDISDDITSKLDGIQAVAGHGNLPFGSLQSPGLTDYADGLDTMQFLLSLNFHRPILKT